MYCTPHVHGGFEIYKAIVEANGGQCMLFRPRHGSLVVNARADDEMDVESQDQEEAVGSVYLLSSEGGEDQKVWERFHQMVAAQEQQQRQKVVAHVVKTDWLLDVAMRQQLKWMDDYELVKW